jgi:general secretion pathway protein E
MSEFTAIPITDLHRLRAQALSANQPLMDVLAQAQQMHVREAGQSLAQRFGLPFWGSQQLQAHQPLFSRWPIPRALQTHAVLMASKSTDPHQQQPQYFAISCDPFNTDIAIQLEQAAGQAVTQVLATPEDIHAYLHQQEATLRAVDSLGTGTLTVTETSTKIEQLSLTAVAQASSPAVKLVSSTLYDALRSGASDVHLESTPAGLTVKYRIDGVLDEITQVSGKSLTEQVISRLKVLAELDIAERRVPQDGSFQVKVQSQAQNQVQTASASKERLIDLRVSIMPSVHGEDAVIRILDKQAMLEAHGTLSLDALGFDAHSLQTLRDLMQAAYGMLLVTGPTGSGKTTTLYAALAETQTGRDKIITIEDPVEYQLPGVLQIPVNEKKGLTFARGLRSILRHDPDKIMVGEIRDRETAEIAVQSALTGHLVLTTVHANNVFDVFGRFTHMGLDPYALVSALNGIWAQRLIRINCPACTVPDQPAAEELARFHLAELTQGDYQRYTFAKGAGCGDCRGTGYKGRRAIAEVLQLDDELREMIVQRLPMRQIKEAAQRKGTSSLLASALALVREGLTTLEEVRRVTLTQ